MSGLATRCKELRHLLARGEARRVVKWLHVRKTWILDGCFYSVRVPDEPTEESTSPRIGGERTVWERSTRG